MHNPVREALAELVASSATFYTVDGKVRASDRYLKAIEAAEAALALPAPEPLRWIAVKDRAPDHREPVVYCRPNPNGTGWHVGIAYWTVSQKWNPEQESTQSPRGFTHWMPLPPPAPL
jgi:hypothetical protein